MLAAFILSLASTLPAGIACAAENPQIDQITESAIYQVNLRLDARGALTIAGNDSEQIELPVVVNSKQSFLEKRLESDKPLHCIRYYESAGATMRIGKGSQTISLNQAHPYIFNTESREPRHSVFQIYSATGELSSEQIELLKTPANFLAINRLLRQATLVDEALWQPTDRDLALLLNLDTVTSNQVRLKNTASVPGRESSQTIEISLSGSVVGSAEGAETEMRVKGKFQIDQATNFLSQVDLDLRESRKPGPAAPGFEIEAALQIKITALATAPQLSDEALAKLDAHRKTIGQLAFASPQNGFELAHDQRWRVITARPGTVVLRMIDAAELLAQCEIVELPNLPKGKFQTLEEFRTELQKAAGQQVRVVADASESTGLDGTQILRAVATGTAGESPMNYVFYQISNLDGRRFSLLFSVDPALSKQFDDQDLRLAESFRFTEKTGLTAKDAPRVAEQPSSVK